MPAALRARVFPSAQWRCRSLRPMSTLDGMALAYRLGRSADANRVWWKIARHNRARTDDATATDRDVANENCTESDEVVALQPGRLLARPPLPEHRGVRVVEKVVV